MPLDLASDFTSKSKDYNSSPSNLISLPSLRRATNCEVCENSPSKYCCPRCFIRYCSLPCFKLHRESSDSKANCESRIPAKKVRLSEHASPEAPSSPSNALASTTDEELYAHPLLPERLSRLLECEELQRLMRDNPALISTLRALSNAPVAHQHTNRPNRKRGHRQTPSDWVPPPDEFTRQLEAAFRHEKFASFAQLCLRTVNARR